MTEPPSSALHHRLWTAEDGGRGVLLVVHGLSEHGGRYAGLASFANDAGYEVAAVDLYGHGRSPGRRGHVRSFETDHLRAVDELMRRAERRSSDVPMFLVGHSLGGLIAGRWAQNRVFARRLHGLVLLAPFVEAKFRIPTWKRAAARLLSGVWPSFSLPTGIEDEDVFREPDRRAEFAADPLVQRRMTAGHWAELERERVRLVEMAADLDLPSLVQVAGDDRVVSTEASLAFARKLPAATVRAYPDAYHALHHDPATPRVLADLIAWAEARIAERSAE